MGGSTSFHKVLEIHGLNETMEKRDFESLIQQGFRLPRFTLGQKSQDVTARLRQLTGQIDRSDSQMQTVRYPVKAC